MKLKRTVFAFILLLFFFSSSESKAQRTYFTSATGSGGATSTGTIAGGNYRATLFSFLWSSPAVELKYNGTPFNAGTTAFIQVALSDPDDVTVQAYLNGSAIGSEVELVSSASETFLAVTPASDYNSIKITLNGQLLSAIYVYNGFTGHQVDCGAGWASYSTRISTSGTAIDPASRVTSETDAVDSDPATYSRIYLEAKQRNVIISQTIYFSTLGNSTDLVRLYLSEAAGSSRNSSKVTVQAFLDNTPVTVPTDLFPFVSQDGTMSSVDIKPGNPFNRVTFSVTSTSNANQKYGLNVYEAQILPLTPTLSLLSAEFCEGASEVISVLNPLSGLQYKWYDGGVPVINPLPASYVPTQLSVGAHVLTVTASRPGCPESSPATVTININPKPITPVINPIP